MLFHILPLDYAGVYNSNTCGQQGIASASHDSCTQVSQVQALLCRGLQDADIGQNTSTSTVL